MHFARNIVLVLPFLAMTFQSSAQRDTCDYSDLFLKAATEFIDSSKKNSSAGGGKYDVYVAKVYHRDNTIGITFSSIINSSDLPRLNAHYYLKLGEDYLVVKVQDTGLLAHFSSITFNWLQQPPLANGIDILDYTDDGIKICQRLLPNDVISITQCSDGNFMIGTLEHCSLRKRYYALGTDIPEQEKPYTYYPFEKE